MRTRVGGYKASTPFLAWILDEMKARHWRAKELADALGMTQGQAARVLTGQQEPGRKFLSSLAIAFNYPRLYVFQRAGWLDDAQRQEPDAQKAIEIIQLLNRIPDDDEREDAIADIRALLRARAARIEARQKQRADRPSADRSPAPGHP